MNYQPIPGLNKSQNQFMAWLYKASPVLYARGVNAAKQYYNDATVSGLGFDIGSMFTSIVDTVKSAAPAVLQLQQQKKLLDLQIKRAKAGVPPISSTDYANYATPAVNASVEAQGKSELPVAVQPMIFGMPAAKAAGFAALAVAGFMTLYWVTHKPSRR